MRSSVILLKSKSNHSPLLRKVPRASQALEYKPSFSLASQRPCAVSLCHCSFSNLMPSYSPLFHFTPATVGSSLAMTLPGRPLPQALCICYRHPSACHASPQVSTRPTPLGNLPSKDSLATLPKTSFPHLAPLSATYHSPIPGFVLFP